MNECFRLNPPLAIDTAATTLLAGLAFITCWIAFSRRFHGKPFLVVSLVGAAIWLGAFVLEHRAAEIGCKLRWGDFSWVGVTLLAIGLCYFILDYAGARDSWRSKGRWTTLAGSTFAFWAIAATNEAHHLFYGPETGIDPSTPYGQIVYEYEPLFFAAAIWVYGFVLTGVAVLARGLTRAHPAHRPFFLFWLLVLLVPVVTNVAYLSGQISLSGLDPSPVVYAVAMMIFSWFVVTDRMLDLRTVGTEVLFRNSPAPILIITPDGTVAAANPAALEISGRTRAGDALATWPQIGVHAAALTAPGTSPKRTLSLAGRRYDLRTIPMEKPLDSRSELARLLVFNDVTEREALEAKLAAERDYMHLLMHTTMTGIVAIDAEGRVIFANAEAGKLIRMSASQMLGCHHGTLFPPQENPEKGVACFESVVRATGRQRRLNVGIRRNDGVARMLSVNVAHVERPGVDARVVCALADITEDLETARTLDAARVRAEAANRTKSQFLANMSHEIRTPLNGVLGMAEVLEDALNDPQTREMARTIRESGTTLLNILNDVLDMSKIEAGKMQIEAVAFDPAAIAKRVAALHATAAQEKGLAFEVTGPAPGASARLGDPHRILQVAHNLLGNAIKFTETGTVRITLMAEAGEPLVIEVCDTGIGMNRDEAARVFAEFEQGDGSVARRFGGTGLGMPITKALVEQMAGEITLETEPGRGTCVRVSLPLPESPGTSDTTLVPSTPEPGTGVDADAAEVGNPNAQDRPPPLKGLRLLAADDNATNRRVLTLMLERAGASVHAVEGGQAALAAWAPGTFDLVLLDISMPDMDGIETLAALQTKADNLDAPPPLALAITANVMTHQIEEYHRAGFTGHAGKPFQASRLTAEVAHAAQRARTLGRGRGQMQVAE